MRCATALFVVLLVQFPAWAQPNFVNGNFETGDFTGWTVGLTSGGATAQQIVTIFDVDGPGPLTDSFGAQFSVGRAAGVTTGEHGVTLTQSVLLDAGVTYTIEFDWAATRTSTASNSQGGIFALMVDTTEITRQAAGSTSSTNPHFGHVSGLFTPPVTGTYEIGTWILRPFTIPTPTAPTLFQTVDNFNITSASVPEPSMLAFAGAGMALVAQRWWARKKSRKRCKRR